MTTLLAPFVGFLLGQSATSQEATTASNPMPEVLQNAAASEDAAICALDAMAGQAVDF